MAHSWASSWAAGSRRSRCAGSSAATQVTSTPAAAAARRGGEQQRRQLPGEHGGARQAERGAGHRAGEPGQGALGDHQAAQRRLRASRTRGSSRVPAPAR